MNSWSQEVLFPMTAMRSKESLGCDKSVEIQTIGLLAEKHAVEQKESLCFGMAVLPGPAHPRSQSGFGACTQAM